MDDDPQFNIDIVRDFMISKNFKVSNRVLVSHFKPFLTHSERREINREKFRDYVNTLSTVKQDDHGEKILVLKKKYRKASTDSVSSDGKKREKPRDRHPTAEKSVSEQIPGSETPLSGDPPGLSAADESFASSGAGASMMAEASDAGASSVNLRPPSVKVTKPNLTEGYDVSDGQGVSRLSDATENSPGTNSDSFSVEDASNDKENIDIDDENFKPVPIANSMSVKERAKHLNKIESDSNLHSNGVKMRTKHGEKKEDDSSSVSSTGYVPMDQMDRDWLITASTGDYHPIHRLLNQKPELANRRDFITGFSALHWAAKHGKPEVVKLLCGMPGVNVNARSNGGYTPLHMAAQHGFEDIIELLVHVYNADSNLRDYSGKKPKQYLPNSASSRSHQTLRAKRTSTILGNGNFPFKRVGSYSAKIHKSGFFGIHGPAILRSSWTGGSDGVSEKDRASPSPSLSPAPSPKSSPFPSPRSRKKSSLAGNRDQDLMPPPASPAPLPAPSRKKRSRKEEKEAGSRLTRPHSVPVNLSRAGTSPELPRSQTTGGPVTSPFI